MWYLNSPFSEIITTEDKYLIAVRILTYQLLHDPSTRTRDPTTPFLVLVNDKVRPAARERLRKDGAIVVPVPKLTASWLKPHRSAWQDVMTKLRLWELLDFERVAFLDADTLLARPLDDVFTDPAAVEQRTLPGYKGAVPGAATPPETYVFAGNANHVHVWMDAKGRTDHLCAGFFVLKPDLALLRYYISILQIPESFMSQAPEEALLNVAHQWGQGMPWLQLNTTLNVRLPGMADLEEGARSAHVKWWESAPGNVKKWMLEWRGRMEDFYETRDRRRG
ncbi:glycosyltransferase family 8 protein [Myriangium duriaei CBS 260.36]|uniref:Glycosyltransferase family 8 protein n=1 Tax=Myriangium duriaei CBS 260.36 TaxID=1168546 RepID=A0A9P4MGT5_9PEZI|nr:glycosyltransferase family 8 protein [Myriangium duriaei CBS 260.36]